ncbi:acyltransferase [Mycobacterium sp.]|uniref:acyltransferase family protein n=1 Tax=Mycobacterium sp. TaxID=1785 RepID=UPI0031D021B4
MADTPVRNLAVDFYRVSGVVLIVLGHWLAGSVTYHDGSFGRQNPLLDQPWTQWLTWPFQAVPTFFLAAGFAGAVSWTRRRDVQGASRQAWLRHRLARVLGPSAVYVALVSAVVVAFENAGTSGSLLEYAGWAVAMQLWFLGVYLVVVSLTPVAIAAQRRWGLLAPAALAAAVAAVDAASLVGHVPHLGQLNYLLCWGLLYQIGIAWQSGFLAGVRSVVLGVGSAALLAVLIWLRRYPVSMIGVPGQAVQNTSPPTAAMMAFGCAQAGMVIALAPALNRVLSTAAVQRILGGANRNVMALYLWHMVPVVLVAIVGYPAGLLPQPVEGGVQWWLARLEWVVVLSLVMVLELRLLWLGRRIFAAPLPALNVLRGRWAEPVMLVGAAMAAAGLSSIAADGFAPSGHFSSLTAATFAAGVLLVTLCPAVDRAPVGPQSLTSGEGEK